MVGSFWLVVSGWLVGGVVGGGREKVLGLHRNQVTEKHYGFKKSKKQDNKSKH
jgi:hypothetical protein